MIQNERVKGRRILMNPTSQVLERIAKSSNDHPDGVFTRLYRYLLREDVYLQAYKNLYANQGAATAGTDNDTADGFGEEYVSDIISQLKNLDYQPKPVRRTYIPKRNGKIRPLGIPSFRDKLVQDAIRQILEAIYEPIFSDKSHGFRPNRSCHTALDSIKYGFNGVIWFVEGDIKGCFDNINHKKLLDILSRKVKDSKFINLIGAFLKAGYMEDWQYFGTYSGTPQGGILSPILANIYLSELDRKAEELQRQFEVKETKHQTEAYRKKRREVEKLKKEISNSPDAPARVEGQKKLRSAQAELRKLPVNEPTNKRICYVRYADDFLIGVVGSKEDCAGIKAKLKEFLASELSLELSEEKTKITHSSEKARFLGYDVSVRRSNQLKRRKDGVIQRTLNYTVSLTAPLKDKVEAFLVNNGYGVRKPDGRLQPIAAKGHRNRSDYEIVAIYSAQIRGICNYYSMAGNYAKLDYFVYIMEYSCLKTLASKHQTTMAQARASRRNGKRWGVRYMTKKGEKTAILPNMTDLRKAKGKRVLQLDVVTSTSFQRNELAHRLKAGTCELCGATTGPFEVHHVKRLKDVKGITFWEQKMLSMRRKTLIVCRNCHKLIHNKGTRNHSSIIEIESRVPREG